MQVVSHVKTPLVSGTALAGIARLEESTKNLKRKSKHNTDNRGLLRMNKASVSSEKSAKAFTLSLIAGILIICNAVLLGVVAKWFIGIMPTLPGSTGNDPTFLTELATVGLIFGVLVLIGAFLLHIKPRYKKAWGIMIIVFSIPSVIMGGGFIIGFILGIIAGKIALSGKPKMQVTKPAITT